MHSLICSSAVCLLRYLCSTIVSNIDLQMVQGNCFELFNYLLEKAKKEQYLTQEIQANLNFFGIFGGNHLKVSQHFSHWCDHCIVQFQMVLLYCSHKQLSWNIGFREDDWFGSVFLTLNEISTEVRGIQQAYRTSNSQHFLIWRYCGSQIFIQTSLVHV